MGRERHDLYVKKEASELSAELLADSDELEHVWILCHIYMVKLARKLSLIMGQSSVTGAFPALQPYVYMPLVYAWACLHRR